MIGISILNMTTRALNRDVEGIGLEGSHKTLPANNMYYLYISKFKLCCDPQFYGIQYFKLLTNVIIYGQSLEQP